MGVNGLWYLLQPAGRPLKLEDMSGKVVAVDISSWLYQYIKALRDEDGSLVQNAHLLGAMNARAEICRFDIGLAS